MAELKVQFSKDVLKDHHGKPYRMPLGDPRDTNCDYRELTAYGCVLDALYTDSQKEGGESGEALVTAKYRKGQLAERIVAGEGGVVDLSSEEAVLIKRQVAAMFVTGIAYPILKLFETK